ncbi:MAG: hypothetical protein IPJ77_05470 [Planctomycetes bacterium]|nr:hypothetical protein [Planctomycetota bacterium]
MSASTPNLRGARTARSAASALLLALSLGCTNTAPVDESPDAARPSAVDALFTPPTRGFDVKPSTTLSDLLDDFSEATGWAVLADAGDQRGLANTQVGLQGRRDVPANEVHAFVESVLVTHGYAFSLASAREPRILRVVPLRGPGASLSRSGAGPVDVELADLERWEREHPGFVLRALVRLEHADGRALANSLRALVRDPNLEVVVPVGDGRTVILSGLAPWMRETRDLIAELDLADAGTRGGSVNRTH